MAWFLADEDFDAAIVQSLRALGHDVLRHQEDADAPRGEADENVLARALNAGRVLLTHQETVLRTPVSRHASRRKLPPHGGRMSSCNRHGEGKG